MGRSPHAVSELDLALAELLLGGNASEGVDFRLLHLLGPFQGIIGGGLRTETKVTPGRRTLAAEILRTRVYGPRHSFA